jgi:cytochrome c553
MRNHIIHRSLRILTAILLLVFISQTSFAQPDGAALFGGNCTSCHTIGKGKVVGPDLKDLPSRRKIDWVLKWVKNSSAVIASGDAYAVQLFKDNNNTLMPAQNLKDDEITAIYNYIKDESAKAPKVVAGGPTGATGEEGSEKGGGMSKGVWALAGLILFILVLVLGKVIAGLKKVIRVKEGLPEPIKRSSLGQLWFWMRNHKKIVAVILIIFFCWSNVAGWNTLWNLGISQGYHPDQPINFSHKIHAGDNGINCVYCHSGAEKSKVAGIPTANVCMNCHKFIQELKDSKDELPGTTSKEEIGKIYKALDYDPATGVYGNNPKPIEWTRVHVLQDFVYFNHSQHVMVGKLQCQTCHGPVETMGTVEQFSKLTMGWCIDCHLATPVQVEGNHYYDKLKNYLNTIHPGDTIKVKDIGGTECARCHY